jgi:hypothetical protein
LHQLAPDKCTLEALNNPDPVYRAQEVIRNAAKIDCDEFLAPEDIVKVIIILLSID